MKCKDCRFNHKGLETPEDAEWILWDDANNEYIVLCKGCLEEYMHYEGEIHLDFWLIDNIYWGGEQMPFLEHINKRIAGNKRQMDYLHDRLFELKKEVMENKKDE